MKRRAEFELFLQKATNLLTIFIIVKMWKKRLAEWIWTRLSALIKTYLKLAQN